MVRPARAKSNQRPPVLVAPARAAGACANFVLALVVVALVVFLIELAALAEAFDAVFALLAAVAAPATAASGSLRTFGSEAVGVVVQRQVSSNLAQAVPVLALGYVIVGPT